MKQKIKRTGVTRLPVVLAVLLLVSFGIILFLILSRNATVQNLLSQPKDNNNSPANSIIPSSFDKTNGTYVNNKYGFSVTLDPQTPVDVVICPDRALKEFGEILLFLTVKGHGKDVSCAKPVSSPYTILSLNENRSNDCEANSTKTMINAINTTAYTCDQKTTNDSAIDGSFAWSTGKIPQKDYSISFYLYNPEYKNVLNTILASAKIVEPLKTVGEYEYVSTPGGQDYCQTDNDCVIKYSYSCCNSGLTCVNKDFSLPGQEEVLNRCKGIGCPLGGLMKSPPTSCSCIKNICNTNRKPN